MKHMLKVKCPWPFFYMDIVKTTSSVALTGKYAGSNFRYHPSKAVALGHRHASFEPEEEEAANVYSDNRCILKKL